MRFAPILAALLLSTFAISASAEDHRVPQSALAKLGLGQMQNVGEQRGLDVRGRGRYSLSMGLSFVSGVLLDPESNSFVGGTDTNTAFALSENVVPSSLAQTSTDQGSQVEVQLDVNTNGNIFSGYLFGIAGGRAYSSAR